MGNSKPRLFIGSSVEGLNIAYAAQQNLQRAAEVTVWDQGVFNLSVTALDSILKMLETCDFALFVFSPDDIVNIRGAKNQAVRDNVIFELGLFVGKLGKERCYILVPDQHSDIRIPTDLIGMTPAKYETNRSDNSYQAATAPACHEIRREITNKGFFLSEIQTPNSITDNSEAVKTNMMDKEKEKEKEELNELTVHDDNEAKTSEWSWLKAYSDGKYDLCIKLLDEKIIVESSEKELCNYESWKGRSIFKEDKEKGIDYLKGVINKFTKYESPYLHLIYGLKEINEYRLCIEISDEGIKAVENPIEVIQAKCSCLENLNLDDEVEQIYLKYIEIYPKDSALAIALAEFYIKKSKFDSARTLLEKSLKYNPVNKDILKKYASLLYNNFEKKQALIQYNKLISQDADDVEFLTLRANIYLDLSLYDHAMKDYKKANEIAEGKQSWVLNNLGNIYNNKGFYHEAISYLKKGLELSPDSEYGHNRLASAIKNKEEETKKLDVIIKDAIKSLVVGINS
jgi:tetratricopeptide (TPR) repeat protein